MPFNGDNTVFSNASLHSRITNAFSDIGRPRRCTLARLGAIDLRAQTQITSVLRSARPKQVDANRGGVRGQGNKNATGVRRAAESSPLRARPKPRSAQEP